jgi:hypothetical protein
MRKIYFLFAGIFLMSCSDSGNFSGGEGNNYVFKGNPPVIFSEIYTANTDYIDEFGDKSGWVEFYNPADTAVNLNGYSLTNNVSEILWTFGNVVVLPHSYLTIFLSGRNKPDLALPSDSIDLLGNAVSAWNWADSQNDPPGKSTAQHSFSKNTGIFGTLTTQNNSPTLGWSSAVIMLELKDRNMDISRTNRILLRGHLGKNQKLEIRFPYEGIDDWTAWPAIIQGTGEQNDLYTIELPLNTEDFKHISGLRFANVPNSYGTINFSFNSIVAQKRAGDIHVSFKLNKNGGKLFLMDSQRQIRDTVTYPAETKDLSFAKNFENGKWMLSKPPTPNAANIGEFYIGQVQMPNTTGIPNSGYFKNELSFTLPPETENGIIRCEKSGAAPSENSALVSGSELTFTKTAILRCSQCKSGAYHSEPIMRTYIIGEQPELPVVSIATDPSMFDRTVGIYDTSECRELPDSPCYGANYWVNKDVEFQIQIDFFEANAKHAWSYPAGLEIMGGWSRANPKKSVKINFKEKYGQKNLRYPLFPEYPNLTKFKGFALRNNGNNWNRDYIRDMLATSLTEGLGIDYQKGRYVTVYYNGEYWGIHNLRERSNKRYFDTNYGIDENNLDLIKNLTEVSSGSDADYRQLMNWLASIELNDENLKQLERRIDVDNFTNYFQSQIYFDNRDWPGNNIKMWRANFPPSKWKWFLYDVDFGFGTAQEWNQSKPFTILYSVTSPDCFGCPKPDWPSPPHSTLMLRKLLQNENYKNAFINRFSVLLASYYSPARVSAKINALMASIPQSEITRDQNKWKFNASEMNSQLSVIRNFGNTRATQMQREIEDFFRLSNPVNFSLASNGNGKILVHNLPVPNGNIEFKIYPGVPITIKAVPNSGAKFNGWSDGVKEAERTITAGQMAGLDAEFAP